MEYPIHLKEILKDSQDHIEELSNSVLIFGEENTLSLYGSEIGITLAMSSVEDILSQYDTNVSANAFVKSTYETAKDGPNSQEPVIKNLTRQDSASSRLETQLKLVCEEHDLVYDDYSHASNSVKRVLLSWLNQDMDDIESEVTDKSLCCNSDDSVVCLDDSDITSPQRQESKCVTDSGVQEITNVFEKTLASPKPEPNMMTFSKSNLLSPGAADAIRNFALTKGYCHHEIDLVLQNKSPPYRSSEIIGELYKNRRINSKQASSSDEVKELKMPNAECAAVKNYFERLSRDFAEEKPNFSREEYLKRNKERQIMLKQVIRPDLATDLTSDKDEECEVVDECNSTTASSANKKKKRRKRNRNKNNKGRSASESDSDINASNKLSSPLPHVNKKLRENVPTGEENQHPDIQNKNPELSNIPINRRNAEEAPVASFQDLIKADTIPNENSVGPKRLLNEPFQLTNAGYFDWQSDQQARPRQHSGDNDVRLLENGACFQAKKGQHLRPIVIDGSNVACAHGKNLVFSCRGIKICIDYFVARGHTEITAFVPNWRKGGMNASIPTKDSQLLKHLEREGFVSFTPSRRIGNRNVVCYDDRFIVELAAENGGVMVSCDNYRDLMNCSNKWRKVIEQRLLMFTFVGDRFMVPQDPLGQDGPPLDIFLTKEEFLRRPTRPQTQPARPSRPHQVSYDLEMQLRSIFPGHDQVVRRILENQPFEQDLNILSMNLLDVIQ